MHCSRIMFLIQICSILLSCSSPKVILKSLPDEERFSVCLNRFTDLTGLANVHDLSFDSVLQKGLRKEFVETIDPHWAEPQVVRYPNPFRESRGDCGNDKFRIISELERLSYESIDAIDLSEWGVFGFEGKKKIEEGQGMAAYIQYRIYVVDSLGEKIDSFVVKGGSSSEKNDISRRQLIAEANEVASCSLMIELFTRLQKRFSWDLPHKYIGTVDRIRICKPPRH